MKETWRWFGPDDSVSLIHIRQAGASGVVTSLHHIPTGEAWPVEDILERKELIEAHGMEWTVVESVPLHNDIKTRTGNYEILIENYITTVCRLGQAGVTTLCYNFMPVVDWTRTNLSYVLPNQSHALRFEMCDFAAYDVHILNRPNAADDYDSEVLRRAEMRVAAMSEEEKLLLEKNIIAGLPGGEGSYSRSGITAAISEFIALGKEGLRANLIAFLNEVAPQAEAVGVRLCIHPDDPPFSLFGLPRVVSTAHDVRALLEAVPIEANGLTLCAGSFGARSDNDLVKMVEEFGERIYFAHLRNVKREEDGSFYESEHLDGDVDMVALIDSILAEEVSREKRGMPQCSIPMRPDHGHLMADEIGKKGVNPGYSYVGRMKGLAELRGAIRALEWVQKSD